MLIQLQGNLFNLVLPKLPSRLDSNNEREKEGEEEEFAVKWNRLLVSSVALGGMQNL